MSNNGLRPDLDITIKSITTLNEFEYRYELIHLHHHHHDIMEDEQKVYDVAIIGGGVVGLSVLRTATLCGLKCILLESKPDLLDGASGRNSGIVCTGVDAPAGSLERALIRDSISTLRSYLKAYNIPHRDCGSLVCLWPWDEGGEENYSSVATSRLQAVADESWEAGDTDCEILSAKKVSAMEPSLADGVRGAVHIKGEIVVDPFMLPLSYAVHARENGATILTSFTVCAKKCAFKNGIWALTDEIQSKMIRSKAVVNASGLFADLIQHDSDHVPDACFESKPRRGQYCIFSSTNLIPCCPIQPVPSNRTKGIFVYSSLYNQLIVGPTALDQNNRYDEIPDQIVSEMLQNLAKRIVPSIDPFTELKGEWVGLRPATEHRDYQISLFPHSNFITAAGIRSTGLTASLGISRYVVRLLNSIVPCPTNEGFDGLCRHKCSPLPEFNELASAFVSSNDDCIHVHGVKYRVTHPITRYGWVGIGSSE